MSGLISIFTISFLDVLGAIFSTILLVYVLLLVRLAREEESHLEEHYAVLAVRVIGLDAAGRPDPTIEVKARLEIIVPPRRRGESGAAPDSLPPDWESFLLPSEEAKTLRHCREVNAVSKSGFTYCVVRGARVPQCLFRLSFLVMNGESRLHGVRLEGWMAAPVGGKRPLTAAILPALGTEFTPGSADPKCLTIPCNPGDGRLELASILVHCELKANETDSAAP